MGTQGCGEGPARTWQQWPMEASGPLAPMRVLPPPVQALSRHLGAGQPPRLPVSQHSPHKPAFHRKAWGPCWFPRATFRVQPGLADPEAPWLGLSGRLGGALLGSRVTPFRGCKASDRHPSWDTPQHSWCLLVPMSEDMPSTHGSHS